MLRRGIFTSQQQKVASNVNKSLTITTTISPTNSSVSRSYCSPWDPIGAMVMCAWVSATFAAWGNQFFSLSKYGIYRTHMMQVDGSILPEYNRTCQFLGACFGVGFYWFIVGPMKYRHSDMEKWSKRVGPF